MISDALSQDKFNIKLAFKTTFFFYFYLWHTDLGTLTMVGVGTSTTFAQEWIFN